MNSRKNTPNHNNSAYFKSSDQNKKPDLSLAFFFFITIYLSKIDSFDQISKRNPSNFSSLWNINSNLIFSLILKIGMLLCCNLKTCTNTNILNISTFQTLQSKHPLFQIHIISRFWIIRSMVQEKSSFLQKVINDFYCCSINIKPIF